MAYKLTISCTKQPGVQFQRWITAGVAQHCRQNYPTDPFLDTRTVTVNTETQWVGDMTFVSEASYQTIYNDPIVKQAKDNWDAYNAANNITATLTGANV